jgi:hypothetical protein
MFKKSDFRWLKQEIHFANIGGHDILTILFYIRNLKKSLLAI